MSSWGLFVGTQHLRRPSRLTVSDGGLTSIFDHQAFEVATATESTVRVPKEGGGSGQENQIRQRGGTRSFIGCFSAEEGAAEEGEARERTKRLFGLNQRSPRNCV